MNDRLLLPVCAAHSLHLVVLLNAPAATQPRPLESQATSFRCSLALMALALDEVVLARAISDSRVGRGWTLSEGLLIVASGTFGQFRLQLGLLAVALNMIPSAPYLRHCGLTGASWRRSRSA